MLQWDISGFLLKASALAMVFLRDKSVPLRRQKDDNCLMQQTRSAGKGEGCTGRARAEMGIARLGANGT